jgi:hypothetical protein
MGKMVYAMDNISKAEDACATTPSQRLQVVHAVVWISSMEEIP